MPKNKTKKPPNKTTTTTTTQKNPPKNKKKKIEKERGKDRQSERNPENKLSLKGR